MEWMIANSAQLHGMFTSLGAQIGETYNVSSDCLLILEEILGKLMIEGRTYQTFRRALGFSQVIKKDLLPLLINVHDHKIVDATVKILVNLTIPVECLLSVDVVSKSNTGRHIIYELNQLLASGKEVFVDSRSTRAIMDYMKSILDKEDKLTQSECESVNNCLLLLRNILHIPENLNMGLSGSVHCSKQNQILWNLFTQSVDKILIQLMTCSHKSYWGVTTVQLIALMYKDQHIGTLQKLLNMWFEASLSESSEDNESNTSPPDKGFDDSSPMLTSDPTSDSSDTGSSSKDNDMHKMDLEFKAGGSENSSGKQCMWMKSHSESSNISNSKSGHDMQRKNQSGPSTSRKSSGKSFSKKQSDAESGIFSLHSQASPSHGLHQNHSWKTEFVSNQKREIPSSETSDCGYATQLENQESISTSSNEDEGPHAKRTVKPVHQKPHYMKKISHNTKPTIFLHEKKEWRRKKLVKRSKTSSMNMKALLHHTPTDEDVSNLLKEFTVDFLLKGYGCLVEELHQQLLHKQFVQIDTSHFFWLVTYFLKFAAQLELELDHIRSVLSFDIVSFLTFEGVNLCEQLELSTRHQDGDLKPCLRRMHLVVTAIRELIQAVDTYKKITHLCQKDREHLLELQLKIGSTEDLKCLFVLLIRQYNPSIQNKQYLQDLIATNHILLLFLDKVVKLPEYEGNTNLTDHIKQFATVEVMRQYGLLLEDFQNNGEFINNCVFTMMHHVGGDLEQTSTLFQPHILKTFSQIWETDFEICDDWSDLIEYVIHKFMNTPRVSAPESSLIGIERKGCLAITGENYKTDVKWSKDDSDNLYWYYVQSSKCADPVGKVLELYAENGVTNVTRNGIIQQLYAQDVISQSTCENLMKVEMVKATVDQKESEGINNNCKEIGMVEEDFTSQERRPSSAVSCITKPTDKIEVLKDLLIKEGKGKQIKWLQKLIVEACFVKLRNERSEIFNKVVEMESVPYHYTVMKQSIPLVTWNLEQETVLSYQPFVLLLHKLGFHLPADSGKVFVRIPNSWTADVLFNIAQKLGPIDSSSLKFDVTMLSKNEENVTNSEIGAMKASSTSSNIFAAPRSKQTSSMIRFTPLPDSTSNWMQFVSQTKKIPFKGSVAKQLLPLPPTPPPPPLPPPAASVPPCSSPNPETGTQNTSKASDFSSVKLAVDKKENDYIVSSTSRTASVPVVVHARNSTNGVFNTCKTLDRSVFSDLIQMCTSDEDGKLEVESPVTVSYLPTIPTPDITHMGIT